LVTQTKTENTLEKSLVGMDAFLIKAFNENIMPGVAVAVVHDGQLVYSRSFGLANIEKAAPVTEDTIFRIMSISKTFTSIAIMQLWEQKRLDLDDPVNPYLKSMQVLHKDPAAPPITFRHLLTHTSGIGEMRSLADQLPWVGGLAARPDSRILSMPEYYKGTLRPEIFPGEKWAYANHGFAVLAQLIEDISGEPFAMYMRQHVLEPLGMLHSDYFMSERVRDGQAQGYKFMNGRFEPVPYTRLATPGCGGIFSNINDMVKYVCCLMDEGRYPGGAILKPETLKQMMTPQLDMDPRVAGMGLGFNLKKYGPYVAARHGGGWPGFITEMSVIPEKKLAVLVFNNSSNRAPGQIASEMLYRLLDIPDPDAKLPDPGILQRPADWAELCGFYGPKPGYLTNARVWDGYSGELEVFVKNGQLMARTLTGPQRNGFPLYRADGGDALFFKAKMGKTYLPLLFQADENGTITRLDIMQYSFYKRPYQQSLKFKAAVVLGSLAGVVLLALGRKLLKQKK
jgi:CubicO group peptidase (beta-lactamase class C family)